MLKANQLRIHKYVKYLRTLVDEEADFLSDQDLLDKFRHCFCCGEEILTKSEQLHSILEFDTPKRAHLKMYENINS